MVSMDWGPSSYEIFSLDPWYQLSSFKVSKQGNATVGITYSCARKSMEAAVVSGQSKYHED